MPLSATTRPLDPRRHAFRDDLADVRLQGRVEARRFVAGVPHQVARSAVPMRKKPSASAGLENEALFGETVLVFDAAGGWTWGQLERDGYVGYLPSDALTREIVAPTHRVTATGTFLYPADNIKSPPMAHLSLNSRLAVVETTERFVRLKGGGFVVLRHVAEAARNARDFVDIAERFIGAPYLWGGRTRIGLDCSGLVQLALEAAGVAAPRDTDMQRSELGLDLAVPHDLEGLQRGDLVFWEGHVGIMTDGMMMVHANAHHMAVVAEPLKEAAERIAKAGSRIGAIKRLAQGFR